MVGISDRIYEKTNLKIFSGQISPVRKECLNDLVWTTLHPEVGVYATVGEARSWWSILFSNGTFFSFVLRLLGALCRLWSPEALIFALPPIFLDHVVANFGVAVDSVRINWCPNTASGIQNQIQKECFLHPRKIKRPGPRRRKPDTGRSIERMAPAIQRLYFLVHGKRRWTVVQSHANHQRIVRRDWSVAVREYLPRQTCKTPLPCRYLGLRFELCRTMWTRNERSRIERKIMHWRVYFVLRGAPHDERGWVCPPWCAQGVK